MSDQPTAIPATVASPEPPASVPADGPGPSTRSREIVDVWSRTEPKYRRRAVFLLSLNFLLFCGLCAFTYWLHMARPFEFSSQSYFAPFRFWGAQTQNLNDFVISPISVERVPMQGVVLGLLVAAIVGVPISVAILYRFWSALPFVAAVFAFAHMPWMAVTLLGSCVLASVKPFRMRFRFGSGLVALIPVIVYLFLATRPSSDDAAGFSSPEQRFYLAAPWTLAVLAACAMLATILKLAGIVNYRPGVVGPVLAVMFATPVALFFAYVGVDELSYRVLERDFGPHSAAFQPVQDATPRINELWGEWTNRSQPEDAALSALRQIWSERREDLAALKARVSRRFTLDLLAERRTATDAYREFLSEHADSTYVANVLFLQARTFDTRLDERKLVGETPVRELYTDFPHAESERPWTALLMKFPDSPLAVAARVRVAQLRLRRGDVDGAVDLLNAAIRWTPTRAAPMPATQSSFAAILRTEPPETSLGIEAQPYVVEARRLLELIVSNRNDEQFRDGPLVEFAALDPHRRGYSEQIARIADRYRESRMSDNLAVRWTTFAATRPEQARLLEACIERFPDGDALPEAMFRLGDLEIQLTRPEDDEIRQRGINRLQGVVDRFSSSVWAIDAADRLRLIQRTVATAETRKIP